MPLLTLNNRLSPWHLGELLTNTGLGKGLSTIEAVAEEVQLKAEPSTLYCVLSIGLSVNTEPVKLAFQVYVLAPLTVKVPVSSGQIELWTTVKVGLGIKSTEVV